MMHTAIHHAGKLTYRPLFRHWGEGGGEERTISVESTDFGAAEVDNIYIRVAGLYERRWFVVAEDQQSSPASCEPNKQRIFQIVMFTSKIEFAFRFSSGNKRRSWEQVLPLNRTKFYWGTRKLLWIWRIVHVPYPPPPSLFAYKNFLKIYGACKKIELYCGHILAGMFGTFRYC